MNFFQKLFSNFQKARENAVIKAALEFGLSNRDQFEYVIDQVRLVDQAKDPATGMEISGYQKSIRVAEFLIKNQDRLRISDEAIKWVFLLVNLAWAVAKIRRSIP